MPYISGMDKFLRGEGPRRGEWVSPFDFSPDKKTIEPKPAKIEAAGLANKPAVIRAATSGEIARWKEQDQQWAESRYSKMDGIDAALAYGKMKPEERARLPEYVHWKLENIYQNESENAKTAAESRYDGIGSSEADAFFRAYGDAANLYLPSIFAQISGGDAAAKAKMGQLNQQRHPVVSGMGEILGWITPSLSTAASSGFAASKPVEKLTGMAERGIGRGLGKLAGKTAFSAAHPKLMRVGTKALQGAASNAIMAGGSGTITGALQSAAEGNDPKTIANDALREGWNSAKYGAIGGGIRGGLHGFANVNGIYFPGDADIDPRLAVYRDDAIRYTAPEKLPGYDTAETYTDALAAYWDDADRLLLQDGADSGIIEQNKYVFNANRKPELRALRRPAYNKMLDDGLDVNETNYILTQHAYNSLFKTDRKDIMPDDIRIALYSKGLPQSDGTLKYINPITGTKVFVNPVSKKIVGIWPVHFLDD